MKISLVQVQCPECGNYQIVDRKDKFNPFVCDRCNKTVQYGNKQECNTPGIIHTYNPSAKLPADYKTFLDNLNPATRSM